MDFDLINLSFEMTEVASVMPAPLAKPAQQL